MSQMDADNWECSPSVVPFEAEGLVEALRVAGGLAEEAVGRGLVHQGAPGCDSRTGPSGANGRAIGARVIYGKLPRGSAPHGSSRRQRGRGPGRAVTGGSKQGGRGGGDSNHRVTGQGQPSQEHRRPGAAV